MTQEMAKTFFESQGWEVSDLKPLPKGATWTTARSAVSPQGAELRFRGLDDDIVEVWTDCSGNIYKVKTQERLRDIMWGHG